MSALCMQVPEHADRTSMHGRGWDATAILPHMPCLCAPTALKGWLAQLSLKALDHGNAAQGSSRCPNACRLVSVMRSYTWRSQALDHGHAFHIQLLRVKLSKDPAARSSALDAAALLAEMCPALVGPLRGGSSAAAGGGLAGAGGSGPQGQGAAGVDAGLGGPGAASLRRPPGPSKAGPGGQEKGEGAKDGPAPVGPKGGAGGTGWLPPAAAGVIKGVGLMMGGEPLEELALLVWPGSVGPGHWQPEYDLPPDMCEDLQWRYAPTAPK